jgi:hypothetical protein
MPNSPAFIAFTGADDPALIPGMKRLSARYPIEWGMLLDDAQAGRPLFPDEEARRTMLAAPGLRWAAHVCGEQAQRIANAPDTATIDLHGFTRVQVNHGFSGSSPEQAENVIAFGRKRGVRTMLQCLSDFPVEARLDWLFDISFGRGNRPTAWPALPASGPFCGYSGGIGPATVVETLAAISPATGCTYWIDMESGVRTEGRFDIEKCAQVCRAVYG